MTTTKDWARKILAEELADKDEQIEELKGFVLALEKTLKQAAPHINTKAYCDGCQSFPYPAYDPEHPGAGAHACPGPLSQHLARDFSV
jgi:hypothetical protein